MESCGYHVCSVVLDLICFRRAQGYRLLERTTANAICARNSYNRYIAVASRVVRRSLKEEKRLQAERRGEMDLRFAKWEVS